MSGDAVSKLIDLVQERPGASSAELAEVMGVSARAVRNYIRSANESLAGVARISLERRSRGSGYHLVVLDERAFEERRSRVRDMRSDCVPQSSSERIAYLVDDLLSRDDWVTLDVLAGILYVSRASISADLKQVEALLSENGLTLERRPRYGIRVTGSELVRRRYLVGSALRRLSSGREGGATGELHRRLALDVVSTCLDRALVDEGFSINPVTYQNVVVHVAIALLRSRDGGTVSFEDGAAEQVRETRPYEVSRHIATILEEATGILLPDEEIAYVAIHLAGRQVISGEGGADDGERLVISPEVWDTVEQMLEAVWQMYRLELRDDLELRMNLARHVAPLSVRLRHNIKMSNPLLDEIKTTYPFAYSMAVEASGALVGAYGASPSDDEVGYIALSFALALERRKSGRPKKSVLVVCGAGMASAQLFAVRLRQSFGAYLGDVQICEMGELENRDLTDVDYVFSTVPIPHDLKVPQLMVGLLLDERDRHSVARVLERDTDPASVTHHYDERLFFPHVACDDKDAAIRHLCEKIREVEDVDEDFEELVFQRERLAPTSFGNRVALPHPAHPASERTFVCVALLDHPVAWNGHEAEAIFLVSTSRDPKDDLQAFYRPLTRLWLSGESIGRILERRTFESLVDELRGGEDSE